MIEAIIALLSSLLTIVVMILKIRSKDKSTVEQIKERKQLIDGYIERGEYEQAAVMASDALDRIDFFLSQRRSKDPPK